MLLFTAFRLPRSLVALFLGVLCLLIGNSQGLAATTLAQVFYVGDIIHISAPQADAIAGMDGAVRTLAVRFLEGPLLGQIVQIEDTELTQINPNRVYAPGDHVVLTQQPDDPTHSFVIVERYRLPWVAVCVVVFLVLAVVIGGRYGLGGILGLSISLLLIVFGVIPLLLAGYPPLLVAFGSTVIIAVASFYFSHGFHLETTLALAATLFTIALALGLSWLAVAITQLFGMGSEDAFYLAINAPTGFDLRGILLAGMLIGTLGVLNDATITQVATVTELTTANPALTTAELMRRALRVGRQHIASVINTLVLAYVGAALPLFLLFTFDTQPLWVTLNSEPIAEEIVRTLVGSTAILLAIPAATWLAAQFAGRLRAVGHRVHGCTHSH